MKQAFECFDFPLRGELCVRFDIGQAWRAALAQHPEEIRRRRWSRGRPDAAEASRRDIMCFAPVLIYIDYPTSQYRTW